MTDNDIIKALECCIDADGARCDECPYDVCCTHAESTMLNDALALINCQKAEIERLKGNLKFVRGTVERSKAEIEKQYEQARADILANMADGGTSCHWCIDQHKAEAIKEFAERLKEKAQSNEWNGTVCGLDIDNLLEEMTEEHNG